MTVKTKAISSTISLPYYETKEANKNPVYGETKPYIHIYPYTYLDSFSNKPIKKTFKTAVLENDLLKLTLLPEFGGRLYSAYDKKNKKEMFYKNDCIRPQPLAARDAWISGGLEFNFPVSHTYETLELMDWYTQENKDGSASIIFAKTEKVSWMRYIVELRLAKDSSVIEEFVKCINPSALPSRFYFWNNGAVRSTEHTKYIFPFDFTYTYEFKGANPWPNTNLKYTSEELGFGGDYNFITWPTATMPSVRNLSYQKNMIQQASIFGANLAYDFFAVYQEDQDSGIVHYGDRKKIKGSKFWTWGESNHGGLCQEMLTQKSGYYAEIQSGPFETQSDFEMLEPGSVFGWDELWFPVSGTKGLLAAGKGVSINLKYAKKKDGLSINLLVYPNITEKNISINLKIADVKVLTKSINFVAGDMLTIPLKVDPSLLSTLKIKALIKTKVGKTLLDYKTNGKFPKKPDIFSFEKAPETVEEYFNRGFKEERQDHARTAIIYYNKALAFNPHHQKTLLQLALLATKAGDFTKSTNYLKKIKSHSDFAFYIAGNNFMLQNKFKMAIEVFNKIESKSLYKSSSASLIILCYINLKDLNSALKFVSAIYKTNARGMAIKALIYRLLGKIKNAESAIKSGFLVDPLDPVLKIEAVKLKVNYLGQVPDPIETSEFYLSAGLYTDALEELNKMNSTILVEYKKAFCLSKLKKNADSKIVFKKAAKLDVDWVFPSTNSDRVVLDYVIKNIGDLKASFLKANMIFAKGKTKEAIVLWTNSIKVLKTYSVVYRNIGFALAFRLKDYKNAEKNYWKALELDKENGLAYKEVLQICDDTNNKILKKKVFEKLKKTPLNNDFIKRSFVKMLVEFGEYKKATLIFETEDFIAFENDYDIRKKYLAAYLGLSKVYFEKKDYKLALETLNNCFIYPKSAGTGSLYLNDLEEIYIFAGSIKEQMGNIYGAIADYRKALEIDRAPTDPMRKFQDIALEKMNLYNKLGIE